MRANNVNKESVLANGLNVAVRVTVAIAAVALVVGCTKKKDLAYKVSTTPHISKANFEGKVFAKVRGVVEADSRTPFWAVPGTHENFGLVKVRITEKELQLISVYDPQNRDETMSIVASYPIVDHFDIKREENDFKEQTHRIVEDREKPWQKRKYMRVDWSTPTNRQSRLAEQGVSSQNTVLVEPAKVDNGSIVWTVETSLDDGTAYRPGPWYNWETVNGYRVTFRNYLTPVNPAADFKEVPYSMQDFSRFGYFLSQQNHRHQFRGVLDTTIKRYANVFNVCNPGAKNPETGKALSCSTNKITWHLSKGFPDKYKEAARMAVNEWNGAFKKALNRSDDVVVLSDVQVDGVDPRYNIIFNHSADVGIGLCGIMQKVEDPRTGQTLSARAAMFESCNRGMLARIDIMIDLLIAEAEGKTGSSSLNPVLQNVDLDPTLRTENLYKRLREIKRNLDVDQLTVAQSRLPREVMGSVATPIGALQSVKNSLKEDPSHESRMGKLMLMEKHKDLFNFPLLKSIGGLATPEREGSIYAKRADFAETEEDKRRILAEDDQLSKAISGLNGVHNLMMAGEIQKQQKELVLFEAEHGIHGSDLVEEAVLNFLAKKAGSMSPREIAAKREDIKAEADKRIFFMVLLHEMGHAFGLRHNFHGSADKDNFHPEYHSLKKKGANALDLVPYQFSSVMDYVDDLLWEGGLSTYDIAAIKYGYNRSIDREKDETFWKKNEEGQKVPRFKFCTDHQVGEDLLCNRFDRGTTVSEVTLNRIQTYQRGYILSHFRRERASFDRSSRYLYYNAIGQMLPIRQVMDEFIYKLAVPKDSEKVSADKATGGFCDFKMFATSIRRGEMLDICNRTLAEKNGVNLMDMETFYNALFNAETKRPYKQDLGDFTPGAAADILMANILAQDFFSSTIGAPEPGTYIVMPPQDPNTQPFKLAMLSTELLDRKNPAHTETLMKLLKEYGAEQGSQDPAGFAAQMINFVDTLKPGLYAKYFSTKLEDAAGMPFVTRAGFGIDKLAAINVLATNYLGVRKYSVDSMNGSPYVYPHTKKFTNRIMSRLVTGDNRITSIPVKVSYKGREVPVLAQAPASLSKDTQGMATIKYLTEFVFPLTNSSAIEKIRVCVGSDARCAATRENQIVSAKGTNLNTVYTAYQTLQRDSIAFDLVTQMKSLDDQRMQIAQEIVAAEKSFPENQGVLAKAEAMRERIGKNLSKVPELAGLRKDFTETANPKSVWARLNNLVADPKGSGLFTTVEEAQGIAGAIEAVNTAVNKILSSEGGGGACEDSLEPTPTQAPGQPTAGGATSPQQPSSDSDVVMIDDGSKQTNSGTGCEIEKLAPKTAALVVLKHDIAELAKTLDPILKANLNYHIGNFRFERVNQDLVSKQSHVDFIIRVLEATGQK